MIRPGKMLKLVIESLFTPPATLPYPRVKTDMPEHYRGKIVFHPERCIGCRMCVRDCPSNAITINKVGEKAFEAVFDLAKCIYCAQCVDSCPKKALESTREFELASLDKSKLRVTFGADIKKDPE